MRRYGMVNFANKRYVYLDEYVVLSPYAEVLLGEFAHRHINMILCVDTIMDYQRIKTEPNVGYMSDVLYGKANDTIVKHMQKKKWKDHHTMVIMKEILPFSNTMTSIGIEDTYGDLCAFINAKNRYDQILMAALIGMNGIMIAFVCYMVFVSHAMPLGYIMACIILIAISIFIAISKGLFRGWDVVTALLDM